MTIGKLDITGERNMNDAQKLLQWWLAWRNFTDEAQAADWFQVSRRAVAGWLRAGLQHHEFVPGLATCELDRNAHGRPVWKIQPFGVVVWHIQRLPFGGVRAPRLVLGLPDIWQETWRAAAAVAPQSYAADEIPPFSWLRLSGDAVLLSCALALRWKASGFGFGGPFILGAETPAGFVVNFMTNKGA